jgi:hypothetical protein
MNPRRHYDVARGCEAAFIFSDRYRGANHKKTSPQALKKLPTPESGYAMDEK